MLIMSAETGSPNENELYIDTFFELWVNHLTLGVKQKTILECIMLQKTLPPQLLPAEVGSSEVSDELLQQKKNMLLKHLAEREMKVATELPPTKPVPVTPVVAAVAQPVAASGQKDKTQSDDEALLNPKEQELAQHKEKYRKMASVDSAMTPLEQAISHQVSYYFGDKNYFRDRYIQEHVSKDSDKGKNNSLTQLWTCGTC